MYGPKDYQTKYVREKNIMWYYLQVQCNKNNTDELIYNTETNSQILKSNLWLPKGKWGDVMNQEIGNGIYTYYI